jgi:riboflavin kinase/FMN adenylyltransferase
MEMLWGADARPAESKPTVVTIGVFDGVHRGHAMLFDYVVQQAVAIDARPAIVTFDPHPMEVIAPERAPCVLTTIDQRLALFEAHGFDLTLVLRFDHELASLKPEQFVRRMLVEELGVRKVIFGEDFRFGHNRAGDASTLSELGRTLGFEAEAIGLLGTSDGGRISSTEIRRLIGEGDVEGAAELLGRRYRLAGEVVRGDERGRKLGFPTANLAPHPRACLTGNGVYAGWWVQQDRHLPGVVNVGVRPTFKKEDRPLCEIHIFDFDQDLYGVRGEVEFAAFLRPEQRFDGIEALVEQIAADAARARELLAT